MELKDIDYLIAVAKYGNISKAAESLYISQPALSKYITGLEKRVNLPLFNRIGNRFVLTYAGERYLARAKEIATCRDSLERELQDIAGCNDGELKIAVPVIRGSHILPSVIPEFRKLYPHIRLTLNESDSQPLEKLLLDGNVDLAIIHLPIKNPAIHYTLIRKECLLMAVPQNNPLIKHGKKVDGYSFPWIDLSLFRNEDFILTKPNQRTRQICDELFKKEKIAPHIILCTANVETAVRLSAAEVGISFAPETFIRFLHGESSAQYFIIGNPIVTSDLVIAYRNGAYLSTYANAFIEITQKFFAQTIL